MARKINYSGFSLLEMAISMSIASFMLLGSVSMVLEGAQSENTARRINAMTTTTANIMTRLRLDTANASSAAVNGTTMTLTLQDGTIVNYTMDNANNFLRNNVALNTAEQDVICTGQCLSVNTVTVSNPSNATPMVVGTHASIQNLRIQSRANNRSVLEVKADQSARYTIPSALFSIAGSKAFL
jgi:Tfp pilus assembly protein PilV